MKIFSTDPTCVLATQFNTDYGRRGEFVVKATLVAQGDASSSRAEAMLSALRSLFCTAQADYSALQHELEMQAAVMRDFARIQVEDEAARICIQGDAT